MTKSSLKKDSITDVFTHPEDVLLIAVGGSVVAWDGHTARNVGGDGFTKYISKNGTGVYQGGTDGIKLAYLIENYSEKIKDANITALDSYKHNLYYAAKHIPGQKQYEIHKKVRDGSEMLARRSKPVQAITIHNNRPYDGGSYGIYDTISGNQISDLECSALCSAGSLYAGADGIYEIIDPSGLIKEEKVVDRDSRVIAMCERQGKMLDATRRGPITESLTGKVVVDYKTILDTLGDTSKKGAIITDLFAVKPEMLIKELF